MSTNPFSLLSSTPTSTPFAHHPDANPSPNPKPKPSAAAKKKRNLPGTPDPDAEVVALSPKSLMATNRFICEICNKGFQRDQNLQLHRRGHNLPWKLRQRTNKEPIKKKVYICPEKTCVHHDPSRALGDLTGVKKHFSRKHGEKKWKCDKCSKKYAVQSDWKAHSKTCGTREYKCDCGTLFSRKDSFITHRAFCDALAEESARITTVSATNILNNLRNDSVLLHQQDQSLIDHQTNNLQTLGDVPALSQFTHSDHFLRDFEDHQHKNRSPFSLWLNNNNNISNFYGPSSSSSNLFGSIAETGLSMLPVFEKEDVEKKGSLSKATSSAAALLSGQSSSVVSSSPMSATALLQKAALMGSTRSSTNNNSPLIDAGAFGVMNSSSLSSSSSSNAVSLNSLNKSRSMTMADSVQMVGTNSDLSSNILSQLLMPLNNGNNSMKSNDQTRDFLGVGGNGEAPQPPFLPPELAKFAAINSTMGLSQFAANH
ncbi:protein indeterminate-domain 9-like [Cucurbita pepo subsp. pepo]|uniref:protein indeterminate-domain 9-like n=1 Tax=Cucurbita pepo subsp. pepo TaxID=3664 RepID=UPI000C9D2C86|nr:protein indeterminate-domain 9-like [Cucurbita pepo subsp. pepo]XP_023526466.1 protein indeterminate-domain 9-like [Cucurbita pepo subsp. pepo]